MSTESEPVGEVASEGIEELGRELGAAISETEVYRSYEEATAAVQASDEAQERIDEFDQLRQEFMLARQAGEATEADLRELQQVQQELHGIPVMADYLESKAALDARLAAVNEAISEPLSVDFGEQAGGCCHD